jgi:hypothetical protein
MRFVMKMRRSIVFGWVFLVVLVISTLVSAHSAVAAGNPLDGAQYIGSGDSYTITEDSWNKFDSAAKDNTSQTFVKGGQFDTGNNPIPGAGAGSGFTTYIGQEKASSNSFCTYDFIQVPNNAAAGSAVYYYRQNQSSAPGKSGASYSCSFKYTGIKGAITDKGTASGGKDNKDDPDITACENNSGGLLGPALCAVIQGLDSGLNALYGLAIDYLQFGLYRPSDSGQGGLRPAQYASVKGSWQIVARLSSSLLVVLFLIMIIAQATSNLIEPYVVKQLLWRIVLAFILINLSWFIFSAILEIFNIIAAGLRGIILSPIDNENMVAIATPGLTHNNLLDGILLGGGAAAAGATLLAMFGGKLGGFKGVISWVFYLLAPIVVGAFITLMIGFAIIVLRQGLIIFLAITSPFAVLLWVSPGTQKQFNQWKDLAWVCFVFYPAFQAFIAIGALLAYLLSATNKDASNGSWITFFICFVCLLGPYLWILKLIQFLGGALHLVANALNSHGAVQGIRGGSSEWLKNRRNSTSTGIALATNKAARQEMRTEKNAEQVDRKRFGQGVMGIPGIGRSATSVNARAGQVRRAYTAEADQKRIAHLNNPHVQELLSHHGDTGAAVQSLIDQGFEKIDPNENYDDEIKRITGGVAQTRGALDQMGTNWSHPSASMLTAAGNIGASTGQLTEGFAQANEKGTFVQAYSGGDGVAAAEAKGMAQQWGLQARGQGQYSHDEKAIEKLDDLGKVSASNFDATMERFGQRFQSAGRTQTTVQTTGGPVTYDDFNDANTRRLLDLVVDAKAKGNLAGAKQASLDKFVGTLDPAMQASIDRRVAAAKVSLGTNNAPKAG